MDGFIFYPTLLLTIIAALCPLTRMQNLPHVAKAWEESDVQGRKEDRTIAGTSASEAASTITASSCSSSDDGSSESAAGAYATYTHYSYLCAPPDGIWVDLKNGIELQR